jgi:hypothetical protein
LLDPIHHKPGLITSLDEATSGAMTTCDFAGREIDL